MPCDAIATARARVDNKQIAELLTNEIIAPLLVSQLKFLLTGTATVYAHPNYLSLQVGAYDIFIDRAREITVTSARHSTAECSKLAGQLKAFLSEAGGLLLQNKIKRLLAAQGEISSEQRAGNGALVLKMRI